MENTPTQTSFSHHCPQCKQADQVYHVRQIYLESSDRLQFTGERGQPELDRLLGDVCPEPSDCADQNYLIRRFAQVFAPPGAAERAPNRLHPDAMASVFFGMLLMMIFPMTIAQPEAVPVALGLLAAGLIAYLIGRAAILRRHHAGNGRANVESAIKRWGRLYFCSRDNVVFHPEENRPVPLEQFQSYINEP